MFPRLGTCLAGLGRTIAQRGLNAAGQHQRQSRLTQIVSKINTTTSFCKFTDGIIIDYRQIRQLSTLTAASIGNKFLINVALHTGSPKSSLLTVGFGGNRLAPCFAQPKRGHIKFSLTMGRQKTVRPVVDRFFRLRWGAWIHPVIGRRRHLWKKNWKRRQRQRRHLFCRQRYNRLFDHMTARFWKRPKYYVDDPYEPYHVRNDFPYKFYTKRRPPT